MPIAPLRRQRPQARPSFASRVKTPYNGSFGGNGNKARLAISFSAKTEAARLSSLGLISALSKSAGRESPGVMKGALIEFPSA
jgi:hypothetical protein